MRSLLLSPKGLLTLILLALSLAAAIQYQAYHRRQQPQVQLQLQVARAERAETAARAIRLKALLTKPASVGEEPPLLERVRRTLLTIRLAEARHRIRLGQLAGPARASTGAIADETMLQSVPGAPLVSVVPLTLEGTYTTLSGLQAFFDDILVNGHSLAALKVEGSRFTARVDVYGRQ